MKWGQAVGLLVLRVVLGVIFHVHGHEKLAKMGIPNVTGMMMRFNIPLPHAAAWTATVVELVGGILLIAGIATRLTALLLAIEMAVVVLHVKLHAGLMGPHGFEFELLLLAAALTLVFSGAGAISVDRFFSQKRLA